MKPAKSQPGISVVSPVFNEAMNIKPFYNRINKSLQNFNFELILVDDGSSDGSCEIMSELAQKDKRVKVISFSRNFGHQIAITAGIEASKGDAVVIIDSDLQDPPEVVPRLIEKWGEGNEVVYALRRSRKDSFFKKITAKIFYKLLSTSSDVAIPEGTGDFRLIDKKVVAEFRRFQETSRYVRGIFPWIGFKHTPVYFDRDRRRQGETKYSLKKMLRLTWHAMTSFSTLPLRLPYYLSSSMILIAMGLGLLILVFDREITRIILVLGGLVFLAASIQLLIMGIMGEYLARIYTETQKRPLYIVKEKINF